ncbi:hypothetical protein QAD02_002922 [Eretmocerus hayati]|uniref:Uncharacterized protein n=1 Tax=Eretmocerus hayati TaxID=131215 RepID=A0ACC2NKE5_9HYME|nr:hypothetical protein QAD02_002922 [Eretmocerus hayati]
MQENACRTCVLNRRWSYHGLENEPLVALFYKTCGKKKGKRCSNAASYSDAYEEYEDVVVTEYVTIELYEEWNPVNINENKVRVQSGTTCVFTEDHCTDNKLGYAFWDVIPLGHCVKDASTKLFEGYVTKL